MKQVCVKETKEKQGKYVHLTWISFNENDFRAKYFQQPSHNFNSHHFQHTNMHDIMCMCVLARLRDPLQTGSEASLSSSACHDSTRHAASATTIYEHSIMAVLSHPNTWSGFNRLYHSQSHVTWIELIVIAWTTHTSMPKKG